MQLWENGRKKLRINKRKFIYLISPNKIKKNFYSNLNKVLDTKKVGYFQLRLKKINKKNIIFIGKKVKKICKKHNVKFILNDNPYLANILDCDGCHLGQKDLNIKEARKIIKKKIIGITCHNSKKLVTRAIKSKADYLAIGAFYASLTKKTKYKAKLSLINEIKKLTNLPLVAIGGINDKNYKKLLLHKVNFLAISSYIWKNKNLTPIKAIGLLKYEN